jgi:hypothetical protein
MALSAVEVITPAWERMVRMLFRPFRFGQWVRLAIVGLLAGELGSGGCSPQVPFGGGGDSTPDSIPGPGNLPANWGMIALGIGLVFIVGIILTIVFMYISARLRFVLFDSVIAGESRVREYWGQRGEPAFRYFVFLLLFALASIVGTVLLLGLPLLAMFGMGWFTDPREHILGFVLIGVVVLFVFLAAIFALMLVQVLIKDFVVPQMALEGLTVGEGWNRLRGMMREEKSSYAGYIGMKVVLSMVSGFVLGMATLAVMVVLLIPFGGIGVLAVVGGSAAGLTWNPLTIALAIVGAALALLCFFVLTALVSVPAIIFFPSYSMHFFAERYPALKTAMTTPSVG